MAIILGFLLAILFSVVYAVCRWKTDGAINIFYPAILTFILFLVVCGMHIYSAKADYTSLGHTDNPVRFQQLEKVPFASEQGSSAYVIKKADAKGNPIYEYCVQEDGMLAEKSVQCPLFGNIFIKYISDDKQPYLEQQSKTNILILTAKPSFWLDFFGWLKYKDYSVGDVIHTLGAEAVAYIFYVPKGTCWTVETPK